MDIVAGLVLMVFIGTYIAISSEKVDRTAMSMTGMAFAGIILIATGVSSFGNLVKHIEWHTILFVTTMMIIVSIAGASGMFQYIALTLAKPSGGDTRHLYMSLISFVFGISLFFDTTSTMLIMGPLTIEICKAIDIDFKPFLISEAIVCNFASIPSIVGAVPNLVIADVVGLDAGFMFVLLMPLAIILFVVSLPIFLRYFNDKLVPSNTRRAELVFSVTPQTMIRSKRNFYVSIVAMIILLMGFTIGSGFGIEPSIIAFLVGSVMLLMTHERVGDFLGNVGWGTVFFLVGLFGLVAALDITGIIDELGAAVGVLVGDNIVVATVFMVWIPGLLSAVIDNIPVSAVLAPLALQFASVSPVLPLALVFAVNIGGFILPIGSPANILALAMTEKEFDPITLADFAKIATPLGLFMLVIGTGWFLLVSMFI